MQVTGAEDTIVSLPERSPLNCFLLFNLTKSKILEIVCFMVLQIYNSFQKFKLLFKGQHNKLCCYLLTIVLLTI